MSDRTSISVVIPAFQVEATLGRAIESAVTQSPPPAEVIVVDDGSSDGTAAVARRFGSRVRLIRQPNRGSGAARQVGTVAATSPYVAFLDADDWWPQGRLAHGASIIEFEPLHFLFGDLRRAESNLEGHTPLPRNRTFYPYLDDLLRHPSTISLDENLYRLPAATAVALLLRGFPAYPSTMLVRRESVLSVGGWSGEFKRSQDFDLSLRLARRFGLHYLDEVRATIGLHDRNANTEEYVVRQTRADIEVLRAHAGDRTADRRYRRDVARALAARCCHLGYQLRIVGRFEEARAAYFHAMKWPGRRFHSLLRWAYLQFQRN